MRNINFAFCASLTSKQGDGTLCLHVGYYTQLWHFVTSDFITDWSIANWQEIF